MPGIATPALAAAVAHAGGLGMVGAASLPPEIVAAMLADLCARTSGTVGVNFRMPFLDLACVSIAARAVRVVELFYGEPDPGLAPNACCAWRAGRSARCRPRCVAVV
jgi:NAD(P)H-dependent flavin oxidoreductase YrpB (nitropropane dioxygenase family)